MCHSDKYLAHVARADGISPSGAEMHIDFVELFEGHCVFIQAGGDHGAEKSRSAAADLPTAARSSGST